MNKFKKLLKILYYLQLAIFMFVMVILLLVVFKTDECITFAANYLVIESKPVKSDVIIVLGGDEYEKRIDEGIRLYKNGYGKYIIFSGMGNSGELYAKYRLENENITNEYFMYESESESTYENAKYTKTHYEKNSFESLILVTSPPQSRRAKFIFNKFYSEYNISISYSKFAIYNPKLIFQNKLIRENFNSEAIKYIYYIFKYTVDGIEE